MVKITGPNLYLREIQVSDVTERYVRWLNDIEVTQYLEVRFIPQTIQSIRAFVESKIRSEEEVLFAICLIGTHEHIGNIKLGPINPHHKSADVSLFIGEKKHWGKGYASEAISLITQFGFEKRHLNKLKAGCYAANESSAKAFERNGFSREGLQRGQVLVDGQEMDVILLGLRAADYNKNKRRISHA